jgi:hypothetical protein
MPLTVVRPVQGSLSPGKEAEKAKLEITPVSGERIKDLVLEVYRNTAAELAAKAGAAMK